MKWLSGHKERPCHPPSANAPPHEMPHQLVSYQALALPFACCATQHCLHACRCHHLNRPQFLQHLICETPRTSALNSGSWRCGACRSKP